MSCQSPVKEIGRRFLLVLLTATYTLVLLRLHGALDSHHRQHHHQQSQQNALLSSFTAGTVLKSRQQQQRPSNNGSASKEDNLITKSFARPSPTYVIDPTDLWEIDSGSSNDNNKKHDAISSRRRKPTGNNLPNWMKDYFRWHKETRQQILSSNQQDQQLQQEKNNSDNIRYLILTCPEKSRKCGGTADRLMSLPFLLLVAARSHRLLLIHWGRPAPLEEFLLPPVGGLDWRIPPGGEHSLLQRSDDATAFARDQDELVQMTRNSSLTIVQCRFQSHDHGSLYYDEHARQLQQQQQQYTTAIAATTTTMQHVMRNVWHICFTPAPPVAQIVTQFMNQHQIVPGQYMASHVRALYGVATREESLIKHWSRNAVNCTIAAAANTTNAAVREAASRTSDKGNRVDESVLLFASDSDVAVRVAKRYGASIGTRVIHQTRAASDAVGAVGGGSGGGVSGTGPLHLDKTPDWRQRPPSDFYESFVDLLLMANARCVTYGMGGYGQLAAWLSWNVSCSMQHHRAVGVTPCQLPAAIETPSAARIMKTPDQPQLLYPELVFYPPMSPQYVGSYQGMSRKLITISKQSSPARPSGPIRDLSFPNPGRNPPLSNLWDGSTTLPQWMKDYFVFHQETRNQLSRENWNSSNVRYLIVECMESAEHCGGTADRLRPIPFYVRLAAETRRLLFFHWDKPKPLEAFLLPPIGGLDWRLLSWLHDELGRQTTFQALNKLIPAAHDENRIIVQARIQAHDHGSKYYNTQGEAKGDGPDAFREHYHDCWYVLFTPVPAIANLVTAEMDKLHLIPGEFAVAHLRALYGIELQQDGRDFELYIRPWAQNALNCLSGLRPGGPFLFSSDSDVARQAAVEYGHARNTTVVARLDAPKPLHLDLVSDWAARNASDFYDAFVDLYLMSFGRCMSYNMGGYGKWAQLISGRNFTCNIRHWTKGVNKASANKEGCNWTEATRLELIEKRPTFEKPLFLPPMQVKSMR